MTDPVAGEGVSFADFEYFRVGVWFALEGVLVVWRGVEGEESLEEKLWSITSQTGKWENAPFLKWWSAAQISQRKQGRGSLKQNILQGREVRPSTFHPAYPVDGDIVLGSCLPISATLASLFTPLPPTAFRIAGAMRSSNKTPARGGAWRWG